VGLSIGVTTGNVPYIQDTNNALRSWNGSTWVNYGGNIHQTTVWDIGTITGVPLAIGTDNLLWEEFLGWSHFSPSPGTGTLLADHVVLSGGTLLVYSDGSNSWSSLGAPPVPAST